MQIHLNDSILKYQKGNIIARIIGYKNKTLKAVKEYPHTLKQSYGIAFQRQRTVLEGEHNFILNVLFSQHVKSILS